MVPNNAASAPTFLHGEEITPRWEHLTGRWLAEDWPSCARNGFRDPNFPQRWSPAKVHALSSAEAASIPVQNKKIDVAFVGFLMKQGNTGLDEMFNRHGVPHITCATPKEMDEFAEDLLMVDDFAS